MSVIPRTVSGVRPTASSTAHLLRAACSNPKRETPTLPCSLAATLQTLPRSIAQSLTRSLKASLCLLPTTFLLTLPSPSPSFLTPLQHFARPPHHSRCSPRRSPRCSPRRAPGAVLPPHLLLRLCPRVLLPRMAPLPTQRLGPVAPPHPPRRLPRCLPLLHIPRRLLSRHPRRAPVLSRVQTPQCPRGVLRDHPHHPQSNGQRSEWGANG